MTTPPDAVLSRRRRALDALLVTVRAARDPLTRELYLARLSELFNIRKDVLAREVGDETP